MLAAHVRVRSLIARLARKRPSPLARGELRIWAGAAIYVVGSVNFLFDRTQRPHMTGDELSALTVVPKSTLASKAKLIRDVLHIRARRRGLIPDLRAPGTGDGGDAVGGGGEEREG